MSRGQSLLEKFRELLILLSFCQAQSVGVQTNVVSVAGGLLDFWNGVAHVLIWDLKFGIGLGYFETGLWEIRCITENNFSGLRFFLGFFEIQSMFRFYNNLKLGKIGKIHKNAKFSRFFES